MLQLLKHQWKEKFRSPFWQRNIILNILLGLLGLYLASIFVMLSFFAGDILKEVLPNADVVESFSKILFFYFIFDLLLRFFLQDIPTVAMQPYLALPIKKSTLLHYPLVKSLPGFFNVIGVLLILPFLFRTVVASKGLEFSIIWVVAVLSIVGINNYLTFILKKQFASRPLLSFLVVVLFGVLAYLDVSHRVAISSYFVKGLFYLTQHPVVAIAPVALAILCYGAAYMYLKNNSYIEDRQRRTVGHRGSFSFLSKYGEIGQLIRTDIRLVLRNKRPRSLLIIAGFFLLYGLMFYQNKDWGKEYMYPMAGMLLTGIFILNYGQFMYSWESSFYNFYLVNKLTTLNYLRAKFYFLAFIGILCYLLTLPYGYIDPQIVLVNFAMLLFNIGVACQLLMFLTIYSTSYIDLGKSQFMNYQGVNGTHFIIILPMFAVPAIIGLPFYFANLMDYYIYAIGLIGLAGIFYHKHTLNWIAQRIHARKHKFVLGFKKN